MKKRANMPLNTWRMMPKGAIFLLLCSLNSVSSFNLGAFPNSISNKKYETMYHRTSIQKVPSHPLRAKKDEMDFGEGIQNIPSIGPSITSWLGAAVLGIALCVGTVAPNTASAVDSVKVGTCLLKNCQKELAQCLLDPKCLANIICLNGCNNRPDEIGCQIKCGDLFDNEKTAVFNCCAVTQKKCVPQREDEGEYPVPSDEAIVQKFDPKVFDGRWYITAGLNELFDTFDCQVHFFDSPSPGNLYAKINWRVTEPDGEFFTKNVLQTFIQDPAKPGVLYNHDNEFLNYQDDWYILDYEPENFIFVYYRGSNDAWDGYGGAVVYTRDSTLNPEYIPRLEKAAASAGKKWSDFKLTDNTCKPQTEDPLVLRSEYAKKVLILEEEALQEQLTAARLSAISKIIETEKGAEAAIKRLEDQVIEYELELVSEINKLEEEIVKDVGNVGKAILKKK